MHVSVPQCDVFGYFSIESEIVALIIPVDHYPKSLQVGFGVGSAAILLVLSLVDVGGVGTSQDGGGAGGEETGAFRQGSV